MASPRSLQATRSRRAAGAQHSTSAVYWFADGSVVPGSRSTLVTNDAGATMTLHTSGLPAGNAITVWWIVFNNPDECAFGAGAVRCGEGDLFADPNPVQASVLYAAGHVVGGSGGGHFGAWLGVGDTAGALFGPGLLDPLGADVHLVVLDHGPAAGNLPDGFKAFDACNPVCVDLQFAVHEQQ